MEDLRKRIWEVINFVNRRKIFVHSEVLEIPVEGVVVHLPRVVTLCIINALVPNGSMLLVGGYGGGKTTLVKVLGRLLAGESIRSIEESIIRAHPEITEEKMVGRLHVAKLLRDGLEEIVWRRFVKSFWKIIDEINRLPPNAQDIIFSLLSEGVVKYFDDVYRVERFVLYATINPRDVGTFPLGLPFLDRFGIAVPIISPKFHELTSLVEAPDTKLFPYDDSNVPSFLSKDELILLWHIISRMPLSDDAQLFISALSKELSLCIRVPKETGAFLQMGKSICEGCHFNTREAVCNKVFSFISVRASQDLARYSKALAWLLGLEKVTLEVVTTLAPYVLWHRIHFSPDYLEELHGNTFEATKQLISTILRNFISRLPLYRGFNQVLRGEIDTAVITALKESSDSDLVVAKDLYPITEAIVNSNYPVLVRDLLKTIKNNDEEGLRRILLESKKLPSPLRENLRLVLENEFLKNGKTVEITYQNWVSKLDSVVRVLKNYDKSVKRDSLLSPGLLHVIEDALILKIHITGTRDWCPVFIEVLGSAKAEKVYEELKRVLMGEEE